MIPVVTLLVALALKAHYHAADAEGLGWILAPTARVTGWLRGEPLLFEASAGWVPADHHFVIAPACAGVNFMIVVFVASVLGFAGRLRRAGHGCAWLVAMLGAAWVLTIAVNSLRIAAAVATYDAGLHAGWLGPERVHRLVGIVVYLSALSAVWPVLDRVSASLSGARRHAAPSRMALPLVAYLAVTVALPLANAGWRDLGTHHAEHAAWVSALTLGTALLLSTRRSATSLRWRSR